MPDNYSLYVSCVALFVSHFVWNSSITTLLMARGRKSTNYVSFSVRKNKLLGSQRPHLDLWWPKGPRKYLGCHIWFIRKYLCGHCREGFLVFEFISRQGPLVLGKLDILFILYNLYLGNNAYCRTSHIYERPLGSWINQMWSSGCILLCLSYGKQVQVQYFICIVSAVQ